MRRVRMAGTVAAGACAAALIVSLAACTPSSTSTGAGSPFATIFPSRAPAQPSGTSRAHATGVESGQAAGTNGRGWVSEFSAATGALIRVIAGPRYGLTDPQALAVDGDGVWVADGNGGRLTELNAATGGLTRLVAGRQYQFADPAAIAAAGGDLWVANGASNTVTEVNAATGALVRVIDAPRYRLSTTVYSPAIAAAGGHVWVPDGNSNEMTEINAATGALIRVIDAPEYQLNGPDAIAAAGDDVWVIDVDGNTVTEVNAATGALVRVISSVTNVPFAITADQTGVWLLTNLGVKAVDGARPDGVVDEFSAATGQPIARVTQPPFRSGSPGGAITADGNRVWATGTNFYNYRGWVAELSAGTRGLVRVIGARSGRLERS